MAKRRGKRKVRVNSFVTQLIQAYNEVSRERVAAPAKLSKRERRRLRIEQEEKDYRDWHTQETVSLLRNPPDAA
jgi:hypothetical protein